MNRLHLFYNDCMVVKDVDSHSKSPLKPELFYQQLIKYQIPTVVMGFKPLTVEDFFKIHDSNYVRGVFAGTSLNGFGNTQESIANSLLWTNGSLVAAAEFSFKNKINSCSPTSGFHHAGYDLAAGFCTFNGLVIAAQTIHERGANRVGILDLDQHYGNGTDELMAMHGLQYIEHFSFGKEPPSKYEIDNWLKRLPTILGPFDSCDLVIYQAGADPYELDPYGGRMSKQQLQQRDRIVFNYFRERQIPVAWCLAGGYAKNFNDVLEIHINTAIESIGK